MRRASMATMASPSPAPSPAVLPARLKRWVSVGRSSDGTPGPSSVTAMTMPPCSRRHETRIQCPPAPCTSAFSTRLRSAKPAAAAVVAAAVIVEEEVSRPTRDTIQALEQARQKIEKAFEDRDEQPQEAEAPAAEPQDAEPAPEDVAAVEIEDETITGDISEEEVIDDGQLYVVEERVIRRHPARILSDGTVEAETVEGWMRFENLEHLDEYLDAMEPARS